MKYDWIMYADVNFYHPYKDGMGWYVFTSCRLERFCEKLIEKEDE